MGEFRVRFNVLVLVILGALFGVAFGDHSCGTLLATYKGYTACQSLVKLGFSLAWTIHNASNSVDFAFSGSMASGGWVGWGINPTAQAMIGTQALIAFQSTQGAVVHTYDITGAMKGGAPVVPGNISLDFTKTSAVINGGETTIFTTLNMKPNQSWTMNHVWNQGSTVDLTTNAVGPHAMSGDSLTSVSSINLATNQAFSNVELPHQKLKNRHGIIAAVAWGLLLPLGIMAARYLRPLSGSNPAWFFIHVTCQCTGYFLGVVSWAMGLKLHTYNQGVVPTKHRNVGISIFALATLQVLALVLRPKPDAKYRKHWNVYHHAVGYTTMVLIIVNIFEGLELLRPGNKWTNAYVVVLCVLGGTSMIMEIITWSVWLRNRAKKNAAGPMYGTQRKATAPANAYRNGSHDKGPVDAV
ncbi:hypothetical protein KC19_5G132200 [Ceratodon purpureus]|uniref:Cytochrome b561 and DOMON domain-containing protein n=1 Tax=Ceratodon purpureus TaxID=3225 RepID=A0A8T0I2D8_CERPU|nr:hypothetical protein KC19_5G132200 [Ceratodon purpureus]